MSIDQDGPEPVLGREAGLPKKTECFSGLLQLSQTEMAFGSKQLHSHPVLRKQRQSKKPN